MGEAELGLFQAHSGHRNVPACCGMPPPDRVFRLHFSSLATELNEVAFMPRFGPKQAKWNDFLGFAAANGRLKPFSKICAQAEKGHIW